MTVAAMVNLLWIPKDNGSSRPDVSAAVKLSDGAGRDQAAQRIAQKDLAFQIFHGEARFPRQIPFDQFGAQAAVQHARFQRRR